MHALKKFTPFIYALSGGILLWAAWPVSALTILIFFAWVPLLWLEREAQNGKKFFGWLYLHMLIWNAATTWWIWYASDAGAAGAIIANSLIMCLPWMLMRFTRKQWGNMAGYTALIIFWVTFEYIHHNWELSWPWLTLGNVFALHPEWVQWYMFTGSTGGTVWVLISNVLVFAAIRAYRAEGRSVKYFRAAGSWILLLILPILISRIILGQEKSMVEASVAQAKKNVVIVQPNVDPWNEKFSSDVRSQIDRLISLSEEKTDANTSLVVWPETAIPYSLEERNIRNSELYAPVWSFLARHPFVNLVTGINSFKSYGHTPDSASNTARYDKESGVYYDEFNTAAFFDADTNINLYHKAKLVPGVETLPSFLGFMGKWFESLGGISGTLGRDTEQKVFVPWDHHYKAAPVICYESIYGDYITGYIRKGANILTIITNDGWWHDTPGYKQHMNYARLRAIETRTWIARSANTGISCFIDPLGNVLQPQAWDTQAAIRMNVPAENRVTFYAAHGDYLSRIAAITAAIILAMLAGNLIRKKLVRK